mgnify:CR=1 FL=1
MAGTLSGGAVPPSLKPMPNQVLVQDNYIDFNNLANGQWAQQYLPELYEAEVERYGNRTLGGFLRMVGAEMPMTSDQVIWSEQNRLHVAYKGVTVSAAGSGYPKIDIEIDPAFGGGLGTNPATSGLRVGNTILISDATTGLTVIKALIVRLENADGYTVKAEIYNEAASGTGQTGGIPDSLLGDDACTLFVYGSEFPKGSNGMTGAIEPGVTTFTNSPIILKDNYELSGSDAAQIGWIEVATEDGTSGYLWYLKAEAETRLRFEDYLEMSMVEGEKMATASTSFGSEFLGSASTQNIKGTEGLFAAIEDRGNIYTGFSSTGVGSGALADFDDILKQLDKQGAIEENMLFLSRETALEFDNMLAAVNASVDKGASYGLFDNEAEMALNFGFTGFRRGSYDFYKTDWKYLNDATTRGLDNQIDGVMIPAGTSTVYDQMMGSNIRRPFLHVRYRASETEDRRFKAWITGSVGGAYTTDLDVLRVNFLSERCLVTQAANNFVLFKGASS